MKEFACVRAQLWIDTGSAFLSAEATRPTFCWSIIFQWKILGGMELLWPYVETYSSRLLCFPFFFLFIGQTREKPTQRIHDHIPNFYDSPRLSECAVYFPYFLCEEDKEDMTRWYVSLFTVLDLKSDTHPVFPQDLDLRRIFQISEISGLEWISGSEEKELKQEQNKINVWKK